MMHICCMGREKELRYPRSGTHCHFAVTEQSFRQVTRAGFHLWLQALITVFRHLWTFLVVLLVPPWVLL